MMKRALGLLFCITSITALAAGCSANTTSEDESGSSEDEIRRYRPSGERNETLAPQQSVNGFNIGGFEYWPFKEEQPLYPSKIKWGFSAGSDPARLCMAEANRALGKILQDPPASLVELKTKHNVSSFFNWNNDYTGAEADGMADMRDLWLYNNSLIKWISETNKDGSCRIPTKADLDRFAKRCVRDYPDC
jgi:hypothetical protein